MKIIQSPLCAKKVKNFHKIQKKELDNHIRKIIENPKIGEEKKGDLKGIYVYKFKITNLQYLLSYRVKEDILELITIGPPENYYQSLKLYLKSK